MALRFGVFVPQGWRMDLVGIADPVAAYETMSRVPQELTFECWTSTAALARDTRRVRIGQLVTCNG